MRDGVKRRGLRVWFLEIYACGFQGAKPTPKLKPKNNNL